MYSVYVCIRTQMYMYAYICVYTVQAKVFY